MKTIHRLQNFLACMALIFSLPALVSADASVSPSLFFRRTQQKLSTGKLADSASGDYAPVTIRFADPPSRSFLDELERHGLIFIRDNGELLHTDHIYPATVLTDSIESIASFSGIVAIEDSKRVFAQPPLDVSSPLVQAPSAWNLGSGGLPLDGSGVIVANVDIGVDVFHPAFFKPDGGSYNWIDTNQNGMFDSGVDAVDLDADGSPDANEILAYYDAPIQDPDGIMASYPHDYSRDTSFNGGIDWLYNDSNQSGSREYGPEKGFTESSPSFGEMFFIFSDDNNNQQLDPEERLTGLGTSKIVAVYCGPNTIYERDKNLMDNPQETMNHGTSAAGIVLGQWPGRTFTGIAPGAELIVVNRTFLQDSDRSGIEAGILWAVDRGASIVMHEFGSWVGELLDGSSNYELMIDELTSQGIHQFTASGNLAGPNRKKHAYFSLGNTSGNNQKTLNFSVPALYSINEVQISILWRGIDYRLKPRIILTTPSGYTYNVINSTSASLNDYNVMSGLVVSSNSTPNDSITIRIDLLITTKTNNEIISGDFFLAFGNELTSIKSFNIDTYIADDVSGWPGGAQFSGEYVTDDGTVTAPATSRTGITVGAFSPRQYRSIDDTPGNICYFSGWGNTIDGRRAVDITAPGASVFTPVSHYYFGTVPGGYYDFTGTSAALPFVTGCAALIVQAAPGITPAQLASVLCNSAFSDEFTGNDLPNDRWGYGKVHVFDSLVESGLAHPVFVNDDKSSSFSLSQPYPNPFNQITRIDVSPFDSSSRTIQAIVYSLTGQKIRSLRSSSISPAFSFTWDGTDANGDTMASGIYLIAVSDGYSQRTVSAVLLK